jgi:hypothetical protein
MKAYLVMSLANLILVLIYLILLARHVFLRLFERLRGWIAPGET